MTNNAVTVEKKKGINWGAVGRNLSCIALALALTVLITKVGPMVFAAGELSSAWNDMKGVIEKIVRAAGAFMLLGGIISFLIAFGEDGPQKKNAIMLMAVGAGLLLAASVVGNFDVPGWLGE